MSFGRLHVAPLVPEFLARHPDVQIELSLSDRFVDIETEGFDVVIRIGAQAGDGLVARRIAVSRRVVCGSPRYFERYGVPRTPEELAGHNCLLYTRLSSGDHWRLVGPDRIHSISVTGNFRCDNSEAQIPALCAGLGLGLVPTFIDESHLRSGELKAVLDDYHDTGSDIFAVCSPGREHSEPIRAVVDFLAESFGPRPRWERRPGGAAKLDGN